MHELVLTKKVATIALIKWSLPRIKALILKMFAVIYSNDSDRMLRLTTLLEETSDALDRIKADGLTKEQAIDELEPLLTQIEAL